MVGRDRPRTAQLVVLLLLAAATPARAQSPDYSGALSATVYIEVAKSGGGSSGSGFLVTSDGLIATAAHVIEGATSGRVRLESGEEYPIEGVVDYDRERDIALIRIAGYGLPALPLGDSEGLVPGQRILALGSPEGLTSSVSDGVVSAFPIVDGIRYMQMSAPISLGSSGGPVISEAGEAVGMSVSSLAREFAQNLNFAVPINVVRGRIALASRSAVRPLTDVARPSQPASPLSQPAAVLPSNVPEVVNEDLPALDLAGLGSARVVSQWQDGTQDGIRDLTYTATDNVNGEPILELYSEEFLEEAHADTYRAVIPLDSIANSRVFYQRTDLATETETSLELATGGGTLEIRTSEGVHTSAIPEGVVPFYLWPTLVASLSRLPLSRLHVWLATVELPSRVEPARFDFGDARTIQLPVANSREGCEPQERLGRYRFSVDEMNVPARELTMTWGARRDSYLVLSRPPHLVVADLTACVELPPRAQQTEASTRAEPREAAAGARTNREAASALEQTVYDFVSLIALGDYRQASVMATGLSTTTPESLERTWEAMRGNSSVVSSVQVLEIRETADYYLVEVRCRFQDGNAPEVSIILDRARRIVSWRPSS